MFWAETCILNTSKNSKYLCLGIFNNLGPHQICVHGTEFSCPYGPLWEKSTFSLSVPKKRSPGQSGRVVLIILKRDAHTSLFSKAVELLMKNDISPLKCHTKTVRNKHNLSNCNVNTIKISSFFQSFWKKMFFCILSVFHKFWLKWSYQLQRKICFRSYSHILTKNDKIKFFFKFKKFGKKLKFSGY